MSSCYHRGLIYHLRLNQLLLSLHSNMRPVHNAHVGVHLNIMYPLKILTLWTGTIFYVDNAWKLAYIWRFTLRALPGASFVVAYETSNPHRSHTRSLEITWKQSENIYEQTLHQILSIGTLCKF